MYEKFREYAKGLDIWDRKAVAKFVDFVLANTDFPIDRENALYITKLALEKDDGGEKICRDFTEKL